MTPDERRALLEAVADGTLTPAEAADALSDLDDHDDHDGPEPRKRVIEVEIDDDETSRERPFRWVAEEVESTVGRLGEIIGRTVEREFRSVDDGTDETTEDRPVGDRAVHVKVTAGKTQIVGDRSITGVTVEGPHTIHESDDTFVVECGGLKSLIDDFDIDVSHAGDHRLSKKFIVTNRNPSRGRVPRASVSTVRVNPDLPITINVTAGAVRATDLAGAVRAQIDAGSMILDDSTGPLDVSVHAGSFTARSRLTDGESRVRCEAGSVSIDLDDESDVAVSVEQRLGSSAIRIPGNRRPETDGDRRRFLIGEGRASLEISTVMSSCKVQVVEAIRS